MANKFQAKSYPCVFIGYRSWNHPPIKKVYISRHVIFYENVLSYTNSATLYYSSQGSSSVSAAHRIPSWKTNSGTIFHNLHPHQSSPFDHMDLDMINPESGKPETMHSVNPAAHSSLDCAVVNTMTGVPVPTSSTWVHPTLYGIQLIPPADSTDIPPKYDTTCQQCFYAHNHQNLHGIV